MDLTQLMAEAYKTDAERNQDWLADKLRKDPDMIEAVKWDPKMRFSQAIRIKAETYKQPSLFEVEPSTEPDLNCIPHNQRHKKLAVSPGGNWCYRERTLPPNTVLRTVSGNRRGVVSFDDEVVIPMIHSFMNKRDMWRDEPWMSFTPNEFFTLRPGTKLARGHTIVAGLGMGHQLEQVCKKRNVDEVTLVEKDQDIVDWILPRLDLNGRAVNVIVGDAYEVLPKLEATVALIDIYPSYGSNGWEMDRALRGSKIGYIWHWGGAVLG